MAVFEETADAIWGSVSSASEEETLVEAFRHLIHQAERSPMTFPAIQLF